MNAMVSAAPAEKKEEARAVATIKEGRSPKTRKYKIDLKFIKS